MSEEKLTPLELSSFLSSRICHDIVSSVGSVVNGIELMEEETDEEMKAEAMQLVKTSAEKTSAKLQYARMCYGASGSIGAELSSTEAKGLIDQFLEGEKQELNWEIVPMILDKDLIKLLLNLVIIAKQAIPVDGVINLSANSDENPTIFNIWTESRKYFEPTIEFNILQGNEIDEKISARNIQPYFAKLLLDQLGGEIKNKSNDTQFMLEIKL